MFANLTVSDQIWLKSVIQFTFFSLRALSGKNRTQRENNKNYFGQKPNLKLFLINQNNVDLKLNVSWFRRTDLESLLKCSRMDDDSNMSEPNRLLIDESVSSSAPASPSCSSQQQPKMAAVIPKTTRKGHRITQFIEDKTLRVRSYFRRRHIPFKRAFELDLQCGTQSLLLQIDEDIEECLYYGHDKLVEQFLSNEGINLAHANNIIVEGIYSFILNK